MQLVVLLAFAPWLWFARGSLRSWPAVSAPLSLRALLADVARVFTLGGTTPEDTQHRLWGLALSLLLVPALVADLRTWQQRPAHATGAFPIRSTGKFGGGAMLVWLYLLVPIILMYLLSVQRPMYKPKFLLLATPAFYMLQGRGLLVLAGWLTTAFGRRVLAAGVSAIVALLVCGAAVASLAGLYFDPAYARDDYRGLVAHIEATAGPDDVISD